MTKPTDEDQLTPTAMRTAESWLEYFYPWNEAVFLCRIDRDRMREFIIAIQADALKSIEASRGVLPDNWVAVPKSGTECGSIFDTFRAIFNGFHDGERVVDLWKRLISKAPPCPILKEADVAAKARLEALEEIASIYENKHGVIAGKTLAVQIRALISKETI